MCVMEKWGVNVKFNIEDNTIRIQEYEKNLGYTDIEISANSVTSDFEVLERLKDIDI